MSYTRLGKPRFYPCTVAQSLATNVMTGSDITQPSGAMASGSTVQELFDMRPSNRQTFSSATQHRVVLDTNRTSPTVTFVAILNHNLNTADGKVFFATSTDDVTYNSITGFGAVLNLSSSGQVPSADGDTVFTFTNSGERYLRIQLTENTGGSFTTNPPKIGCILIGKYYDSPHRPDLGVRGFNYDGNKISQTRAGLRYSNAQNLGAPQTGHTPFRGTSKLKYGGRMYYDLKMSFVDDTEIFPDDIGVASSSHTGYLKEVFNTLYGSHLPFIFQTDGADTSPKAGDLMFARMGKQPSFDETSPNMMSVSMRIEEEF